MNQKEQVARMYKSGMSITKICSKLRIGTQKVYDALKLFNIETRSIEKVKFETIKQEYESGLSVQTISKKHNMNQVSIWERLVKGGVQMRDRKEEAAKATTKIPAWEHPKIVYVYTNCSKTTCADIAKDYGVHKSTIANILRKNGVSVEIAKGERCHLWKGGITELHNQIRNCTKIKEWKKACMERDDYTCQITGERGGKLHVHHRVSFSTILKQFLDSGKETFEEALEHEPFWDLSNGMTLSEEAHLKLHKDEIDQDLLTIARTLLSSGYSINKIANITRRNWHTIKRIINTDCV